MMVASRRRAMHENALRALQRSSSLGPNAAQSEVGPWLLVDADSSYSFLNVAALRSSVGNVADAAAQARQWFAARGVDYRFLLDHNVDRALIDYLVETGCRVEHGLPAMLLDPIPSAAPTLAELEIVVVTPGQVAREYGAIGGQEQGLDRSLMMAIAEAVVVNPDFVALLARIDGTAVATSLALVTGDMVGIYNVNVVAPRRRRGLGTAMTWAAARVGYDNGCRAAFLEATPQSYGLYQRMGFRTQYHYLQLAP
jgi:GNAT superfamily N-acetyltransferase